MVEPHLLHFGGIPQEDPLLCSLLPRIPQHLLGFGHPRLELSRLYRRLSPDAVILGEGPCAGLMAAAYESARDLGVRLVCIENLYRSDQPDRYTRDTPAVDQWLLLGLPIGHRYGRISPNAVLVPPLLSTPSVHSGSVTLTILGYDRRAAELGLDLMERLPSAATARLVISSEQQRTIALRTRDGRVSVVTLPSERDLAAYLRSSQIVVCKSGFQQIVESLAVGTPVITYEAAGGIPEAWLAPELRPFVRYIPTEGSNWCPVLSAAALWLARRPAMPWGTELARVPSPPRFAARWLAALLRVTPIAWQT